MKVSITGKLDDGKTVTVVLGDDRKRNFISRYLPAQSRNVQVDEATRAEDVTVRDRKNKRNDVSIVVSRTHDSLADALSFLRDHADAVPTVGSITLEENYGGKVSVSKMMNAAIPKVECIDHSGASTQFSYTIVGGKFS